MGGGVSCFHDNCLSPNPFSFTMINQSTALAVMLPVVCLWVFVIVSFYLFIIINILILLLIFGGGVPYSGVFQTFFCNNLAPITVRISHMSNNFRVIVALKAAADYPANVARAMIYLYMSPPASTDTGGLEDSCRELIASAEQNSKL